MKPRLKSLRTLWVSSAIAYFRSPKFHSRYGSDSEPDFISTNYSFIFIVFIIGIKGSLQQITLFFIFFFSLKSGQCSKIRTNGKRAYLYGRSTKHNKSRNSNNCSETHIILITFFFFLKNKQTDPMFQLCHVPSFW